MNQFSTYNSPVSTEFLPCGGMMHRVGGVFNAMKDLEIEIWKDISGYEGLYQASSFGAIKSLRHEYPFLNKGKYPSIRKQQEKILSPGRNKYGYYQLSLTKDNKARNYRVNRLIALTFHPNPNNLPQVNHKDGVKANNRVSNLEWCTPSENIKHAQLLGLIIHMKGEKSPHRKLNLVQVLEIREKYATGGYTQALLATQYNISHSQIGRIVHFQRW